MERVLELAKPLPLYQSVLLFIERFGLKDTPEQAMNEMISMMRQHYQSDVKSKPGAEEYLKKLKKCGVHMCIVTATPRHLVEVCLSRLNLTSYFDFLLSCDEVGAGKDHPDAFYEAAHRLGSAPSEIAVFEDSLQAAKTAKQAGFYTIEGLVRTVLVKAVCALAALNIHAKHLALAVCAAQMRVLCKIAVHADEDAVMMLVFVRYRREFLPPKLHRTYRSCARAWLPVSRLRRPRGEHLQRAFLQQERRAHSRGGH